MNKKDVNAKEYGIIAFCYDMLLDVLGDYPSEIINDETDEEQITVKNAITLKIVAVKKDPPYTVKGKTYYNHNTLPISKEYERLFYKYIQFDVEHTILDIVISKVPIKIAIEESELGGESEAFSRNYYTTKTIDKYVVKKRNSYEIYFQQFPSENREDFYTFYNFIFQKAVGIQPNVFTQKFDLWRLAVPPKLLLEDEKFFLDYWNKIRLNLGSGNDAFSQFLIDSFDSIKSKLKRDKIILECKNCGNLTDYNEYKKYCSDKCRKKSESKRYYKKYQKKLKKIKRVDMQDTRKCYKERGVKK
jgi:hypothetical protein